MGSLTVHVVDEDQRAVMRALLRTPPLPMADIPRKRDPKLKTKRRPKKS